MSDLQSYIDTWKERYCPGVEISIAYGRLSGDLLGNTHYVKCGQKYNSAIIVNVAFENDPFTSYVIAWHEFAHAWAKYETSTGGHGKEWIVRWMWRPLMTIPAYIVILPNVIRRMAAV